MSPWSSFYNSLNGPQNIPTFYRVASASVRSFSSIILVFNPCFFFFPPPLWESFLTRLYFLIKVFFSILWRDWFLRLFFPLGSFLRSNFFGCGFVLQPPLFFSGLGHVFSFSSSQDAESLFCFYFPLIVFFDEPPPPPLVSLCEFFTPMPAFSPPPPFTLRVALFSLISVVLICLYSPLSPKLSFSVLLSPSSIGSLGTVVFPGLFLRSPPPVLFYFLFIVTPFSKDTPPRVIPSCKVFNLP